jgi:hypothetical protein
MLKRVLGIASLFVLGNLVACSSDPRDTEDLGGTFQALSDDEVIDPSDPPTDPDPPDVAGAVDAQDVHILGGNAAPACPSYDKLSPKGLTFVIDIVDANQFDDLMKVKRFIRARDVFVVRPTSGPVAALEKNFPCNRIMALAYPSELKNIPAMENEGIDAVVLDWEGADQAQSASTQRTRLANIKQEIVNHKMRPSMAPGTDWVNTAADANYDSVLAQTQPACKNSVDNFGAAAKRVASEAQARLGIRNAAVEVSVDSSASNAVNHVDAERGADCARAGYGKGARAVYVFGQQEPHFVPFFARLHQLGVRAPR